MAIAYGLVRDRVGRRLPCPASTMQPLNPSRARHVCSFRFLLSTLHSTAAVVGHNLVDLCLSFRCAVPMPEAVSDYQVFTSQ